MAQSSFSGPVVSENGFQGTFTGPVVATTVTASGAAELTNAANVLVIPDSDPGVANALWLDGSTIKVSAGA